MITKIYYQVGLIGNYHVSINQLIFTKNGRTACRRCIQARCNRVIVLTSKHNSYSWVSACTQCPACTIIVWYTILDAMEILKHESFSTTSNISGNDRNWIIPNHNQTANKSINNNKSYIKNLKRACSETYKLVVHNQLCPFLTVSKFFFCVF